MKYSSVFILIKRNASIEKEDDKVLGLFDLRWWFSSMQYQTKAQYMFFDLKLWSVDKGPWSNFPAHLDCGNFKSFFSFWLSSSLLGGVDSIQMAEL